jgi:transcriptional regulator with XRE-family HTH domain
MGLMEGIKERLKKIRENAGLNQTEFSKRIKINQSTYSGIENGRESLTDRNRRLICLEFGIEETWLLTGQGSMVTPPKPSPKAIQGPDGRELSPEEQELIGIYDQLIPETQREVLKYANDRLELQELREQAGKEAPAGAEPEKSTGINSIYDKDRV